MSSPTHSRRQSLPTTQLLRDEFTINSAIHPDLYELNCEIIHDVEIENGEPTTPIHDALNWGKMSRFTEQTRKLLAVVVRDHKGEVYQCKVYSGREKDGHPIGNYFAPKPPIGSKKGENDKIFKAAVPQWFCDQIAADYGLEPPLACDFWQWFIEHKEIALTITEGVKKDLAGLSDGKVTVSLFGCLCGVDKITRLVRPELLELVRGREKVYVAFDSDTKPSAIKAVQRGLARLCRALGRSGAKNVYKVQWDSQLGKGLDDLLKNNPGAFDQALKDAKLYSPYELYKEAYSLAKFNPVIIHERFFFREYDFPDWAKLICLKGAKKTGKTECITISVKKAQARGQKCFVIAHRIKLAQALCIRLGLNHLTDITQLKTPEGKILGYGLCIDSLRPSSSANFSPDEMCNALVIFDEVDEVLLHALAGNTLIKNGQRVEVLLNLSEGIKNCLSSDEGKIFLISADLSAKEINFFGKLGENPPVFVLENTYKPIKGKRKAFIYSSAAELMISLEKAITRGEKVLVHLSSQKEQYAWSTTTTETKLKAKFPHLKILRIDSDSVSDVNHPAFNCMDNLDVQLSHYDIVLASPTIETGISIELENHFNSVWVIANGTQTVNAACQTPERLRADVERHIFIADTSNQYYGNGAIYPQGLLDWKEKRNKLDNLSLNDCAAAQFYCSVGELFTNTWAEYASEHNLWARHYKEIILGKLRDEGYELIQVAKESKERIQQEKDLANNTSDQLYTDKCIAVAQTPNPNDQVYLELETKQDKTKEDKRKHLKGTICRVLLTSDVSPELVEEYDNEGLYQKQDTLYSLFEGKEFVDVRERERLDKLEYKGKVFEPDKLKRLQKAKLATLDRILLPVLIPLMQGEIVTKDSLKSWFDSLILPHRQDIKDYIGLNISANPKISTCISVLGDLLDFVGQSLIKLSERDGQVWPYKLDLKQLDKHKPIRERWFIRDCSKYRGNSKENVTSSEQKCKLNPITIELEKNPLTYTNVTSCEQNCKLNPITIELEKIPSTYTNVTSSEQKCKLNPITIELEKNPLTYTNVTSCEQNCKLNPITIELEKIPSTYTNVTSSEQKCKLNPITIEKEKTHLTYTNVTNCEQNCQLNPITIKKEKNPSTYTSVTSSEHLEERDQNYSLVKDISNVLLGIDHTNREDYKIFAHVFRDHGHKILSEAISLLNDLASRLTLTTWLTEVRGVN